MRFIDQYIPAEVPGFPCISSPRFSNDIQIVDSGAERVTQRWSNPLHTYSLPDAVRNHSTYEGIHNHWMVMRGTVHTFPFRDPLDFASVGLQTPNVEPTLSGTDQVIGVGDGVTTQFQLTKTYTVGAETYTRDIYHPVLLSTTIFVDGQSPGTLPVPLVATVSRDNGIVSFDAAPASGDVITAGYLFDVEVRFSSDDAFDGIVKTYGVSGFADIEFVEVRPCE